MLRLLGATAALWRQRPALIGYLVTLCWLAYTGNVFARGSASDMTGDFSVGMATPIPTGVTAKYWVSRTAAYDVFAEWSISDKNFHVHGDYLVHDFNQVFMDDADAPVYYGIGVMFGAEEGKDAKTGIRIPFGIDYLPRNAPFDVFGEAAPRMDLAPSTNFGLDLQIGIRYRF